MSDSQKELQLDLDYIASTYGIRLLVSATVESDDHGNYTLVLRGYREE